MPHQQQEIPACCRAPQTSTRASLSVTSSGVLRSACCCFQNSTRTPVRRFPWQLHDSTSDVLYVSTELYFNCSCNLSVFCSWDMMTFHIKSHARSIIFCPSSDTNKIPGRKLIASAKYQTVTTGMFHKALGILPGLFHGWSTTRLLHEKKYPYTVLYYSTEPLHYSTPNYYCTVVYQVLTVVLLLYCITVLFCTDVYCFVLLY